MDLSKHFSLSTENPLYLYGAASLAVTLYVFFLSGSRKSHLDKIPTVGPDGLLLSYLGAFRWLSSAKEMVQDGYDKYKGAPFKVANFNQWLVIVGSHKLIEELRKAEDDELSFLAATVETLAIDHTLGPGVHTDDYHIPIIRNQLTKNLGALFPDVRNEIVEAFDEIIPLTSGWTKVRAHHAASQIICRTANRVFVGSPLCRNPDWMALNLEFTVDVIKGAAIINHLPHFMKPIVGRLFTNVSSQVKRGMKHMVPIIQDRQRHIEEYGNDWDDKPNDLLSWLMDNARGDERSLKNLTLRMLLVNFAAIHTSLMSFTHVLYNLAVMPHYIQPLREEVDAIIREEGWSKASLGKMLKVDSFLKETQRVRGLGVVSLNRKALKDYTFSDGTVIPKHTIVCAAQIPVHRDEDNYTNPHEFDGFRFANMRMSENGSAKHQLVATDWNFLSFGHGRHACPGRFFVAAELKAMLAHVVLNYDVKMENEGVRPPDLWLGSACLPNPTAEVLFRKRQD